MKRFLLVSGFLFVFALAARAGSDDDLKVMQGTWSATIIEAAGKPPPAEEKETKIKVVVKGNAYTVFFNDKQIVEGTLKLDAKKKPKTIDAIAKDGPLKDKVQPGIYEIKGADEMRLLFTQPDMDRPTEFKTKEKSLEVLMTYKRIKEKK